MPAPFDIDTVARRFAPLVRFHPEEEFLPSSTDWYLKRVSLIHVTSAMHARRPPAITKVLARGQVDAITLVSQKVGNDQSGGTTRGTFFLDIPGDSEEKNTRRGDLSSARCYVHVQPGSPGIWRLAYLFFYPFNGAITELKFIRHEGDWEHIKVEVNAVGDTLRQVYFSAHEGGQWQRRYSTAEGNTDGFRCFENTHPIVYSARHSHASYPSTGRHKRLPADDHCGNGTEWRTWDSLEVLGDKANPLPGQEWLKFNGLWGEYVGLAGLTDGPTGPAFKTWWKDNGFDA